MKILYKIEEKMQTIVIIFLVVVLPMIFAYGGIWLGLLAFIVFAVILGWKDRHNGPFPTDKKDK